LRPRWLPLAFVVGAVALAVVTIILEVTVGGFGSHRDSPRHVLPRGVVARVNIVVTEPDGNTRTAGLECAGKNKGSGYLSRTGSAAFACETMLINWTVNDYLTGHKVSGPSCKKTFNPPPRALVAHFEGWISENRVDRTLDVANDPCGEALAVIMFPLLESTAEHPNLDGL
jgi:hypothetical protein